MISEVLILRIREGLLGEVVYPSQTIRKISAHMGKLKIIVVGSKKIFILEKKDVSIMRGKTKIPYVA